MLNWILKDYPENSVPIYQSAFMLICLYTILFTRLVKQGLKLANIVGCFNI
ncbi:hypothetical protein MGMO_27c00130 [Methyloglobulus morosus KoM1]|uniref:Uncharacterized protein n=1 Tax=Methyloglobulus morosus KoM1 TaxID=1116472 RepID=V5BIY1_9GAMM|nr:hypothetical protein MGMO_27c00130 [Methyloglobulus morosus KoM1]